MDADLKLSIDALIALNRFNTPKNTKWELKQSDPTIEFDEEAEEYINATCQRSLEEFMFSLNHPAQISSVQKYLQRNFPDWNPDVTEKQQQQVVINFDLTNTSENRITPKPKKKKKKKKGPVKNG